MRIRLILVACVTKATILEFVKLESQKQGINLDTIVIDDYQNNLAATVWDISDTPHQFKFLKVDAVMMPRTLDDIDAAIINTNYALATHLSHPKGALAIEGRDSTYANFIAVQTQRADLIALRKAMTSEAMRSAIRGPSCLHFNPN